MPTPSSSTNRIVRSVQPQPNNNDDDETPSTATNTDYSWLWTCILPLWTVYITNQWNRYSINYLVDFSPTASAYSAMNIELHFDQAAYGILASVAFTILYAFCTLGAGVAADRVNRRQLVLLSTIGFSGATLLTTLATSYEQVFLLRIAMGIFCAVTAPTAYALIPERVPAAQTALATSLYGTAVAVASGVASLSLILDQTVGWRNTLLIIGGFGILSVGVAFLLLEDDGVQQSSAKDTNVVLTNKKDTTVWQDVQLVLSTSRVQWLLLGSLLRFGSGLSIGVWGATYFRMTFSDNVADYAVAQAAISAIGASASGILGGAIADRLTSDGTNIDPSIDVGRRLWVPVVGSILAAPAWYYAVHAQDFGSAMGFLALEYFVAECWFGPTISTLQATVAGNNVGGTAQGMFTLTGALANAAPSVLGFLYASSANDSSADLSELLAGIVCFGYLSSAVCFGVSALSPPIDTVANTNNDNKPKAL